MSPNPALLTWPAPVAAGGGGASYSFVTSTATSTGSTTRTFSSVSIGSAAPNRTVIITLHSRGGARVATSLTVGGVSATLQAELVDDWVGVQVWTAAVPTGATANIVATLGATTEYIAIGVWASYGTLTYSTSGTNGTGGNITLTAPENCLSIAAKTTTSARGTETLGGLDQDYTYDAWACVFGNSGQPDSGSHTVAVSGVGSNNAVVAVDFTLT